MQKAVISKPTWPSIGCFFQKGRNLLDRFVDFGESKLGPIRQKIQRVRHLKKNSKKLFSLRL
jgi:hypothetical protein